MDLKTGGAVKVARKDIGKEVGENVGEGDGFEGDDGEKGEDDRPSAEEGDPCPESAPAKADDPKAVRHGGGKLRIDKADEGDKDTSQDESSRRAEGARGQNPFPG